VSTHCYRITIAGGLGEIGREAFADFLIEPNGRTTALTGELDQAALYGALNRILALGLELMELSRVTERTLARQPDGGWVSSRPGTNRWAARHSGGSACLTPTSSSPSARIRSSSSCRAGWSRSPDNTVMVGSTSTSMSANASRAAGPSDPTTLIS
jgi:hypothetical protein